MSNVTTRFGGPSLVLAVILLAAVPVGAQQPTSAALVGDLASLMSSRQIETIAAPDPEVPGGFVAALLVPKVQLLVVAAQYPSPADLQAHLTQGNYREVYTALHQPSAQSTRFFLLDTGCDGLRNDADNVDVLYEKGTTQTLFDGRWKQQNLSEADYRKRGAKAEARYARLLSALVSMLRAPVTSTASK